MRQITPRQLTPRRLVPLQHQEESSPSASYLDSLTALGGCADCSSMAARGTISRCSTAATTSAGSSSGSRPSSSGPHHRSTTCVPASPRAQLSSSIRSPRPPAAAPHPRRGPSPRPCAGRADIGLPAAELVEPIAAPRHAVNGGGSHEAFGPTASIPSSSSSCASAKASARPVSTSASACASAASGAISTSEDVDPDKLLSRRRQATKGGRKFFQWSFRAKKGAMPHGKYAMEDIEE